MKKILFVILSLLFSVCSLANDTNRVVSERIDRYEDLPTIYNKYVVEFDVGTRIVKRNTLKETSCSKIRKVEYYYSSPEITNISIDKQRVLNGKRLNELYELLPCLNSGQLISFKNYEVLDKESFHGFVVSYIDEKFNDWNYIYKSMMGEDPFSYNKEAKEEVIDIDKMSSNIDNYIVNDSTISKVFRRNLWSGKLVISDVTGSMSPYLTDLIAWFRLTNYSCPVIFFNDGDFKMDGDKEVGETGGIRALNSSFDFNELINLLYVSIVSGNGGDSPENDIEAVLTGVKKYENAENVILVADNFSDMRDFELVNQITKPVKVILCGTNGGINTQYLELARKTGGSVHTIEEDIEGLALMKEGEVVEIGGQSYRTSLGKFYRVKN